MLTKIIRADGTTELANIKQCTFIEQVNGDTDLRVGCVSSAQIEVVCFGEQSDAPTVGEELTYYQVDNDGVETKIGVFYAQPSIPTKYTYSFIAYDAVSKLDVDFSERLTNIQDNFPMTIMNIVEEAVNVAGVTLVSGLSFPLSDTLINAFSVSGVTCRNILEYAAQIAGRFVRCNADGEIIFDWYKQSSYSISPSDDNGAIYYKQDGLTYENYATSELARVRVYQTNIENLAYEYPIGGSGNTYDLAGNMLLMDASDATYTAVAENIYNVLTAFGTYRPFNIKLFPFNNPFRAGDIVSITDAQGVTFTAPVMSMQVSQESAVLSATGNQEYADASSSLNSTIIALQENAKDNAETNAYFWFQSASGDEQGAHITQIPKDKFIENPQGGNSHITSDGMKIKKGAVDLAAFTPDALYLYDENENKYFEVATVNGATGEVLVSYMLMGDGVTTVFSFDTRVESIHDVMDITAYEYDKWIDENLYDLTDDNTSITFSYAIPDDTPYEVRVYMKMNELKHLTMGKRLYDAGEMSAVFGLGEASGKGSMSVGTGNRVKGAYSAAFGVCNYVESDNSFAFGEYLTTKGKQFIIGDHNAPDEDKIFIIGTDVGSQARNEYYDERYNSFTIDKYGNIETAGNYKMRPIHYWYYDTYENDEYRDFERTLQSNVYYDFYGSLIGYDEIRQMRDTYNDDGSQWAFYPLMSRRSFGLEHEARNAGRVRNAFYLTVDSEGGRHVTFYDNACRTAWQEGLQLGDLFQIKSYSYTYSVAAGTRVNITGANFGVSTPSGYAPVAITRFGTGSQYVYALGVTPTVTGSSQVMALKNVHTSAVSGATASIDILYMRTAFRA